MSQIKPEMLTYLAVGVPEFAYEQFTKEAVATLERRGYSVMVMQPKDIMDQAEHIKKTYEKIANEETD